MQLDYKTLEYYGLVSQGMVELFVLYHSLRGYDEEILAEYGADSIFSDGGNTPQGPVWACEVEDLPEGVLSALEADQMGYHVVGEKLRGYHGGEWQDFILYSPYKDIWHLGYAMWCGYKSRNVAYLILK